MSIAEMNEAANKTLHIQIERKTRRTGSVQPLKKEHILFLG